MKTRKTVFEGQFYPEKADELITLINTIEEAESADIDTTHADKEIIGGIVPHAGYEYSGYEALHFFSNIKKSNQQFNTVVILNPDHQGMSEAISVDSHDSWDSPLGEVKVDTEFAKALGLPLVPSHFAEHSAEVVVPLLQYFLKQEFRILPITISEQTVENARTVARVLHDYVNERGKKILVVASSDFSHFETAEKGKALDDLVAEKIIQLDVEGVYNVINKKDISVCGYGPIMALMEYSKLACSHPSVHLLSQGNSAKRYPSDDVVGYISMIFRNG